MALCMGVWVVAVHRFRMHRCLLAVVPIVLVLLNSELAVSLATLLMSDVGVVWVVGRARFLDSSMLVLMMFNRLAVLHFANTSVSTS